MKKNMGYILIVIGALLCIAGVVIVLKSSPEVQPAESTLDITSSTPIESEEAKAMENESSSMQTESQQKGQEFEKYVVSNFPGKYYSIKEWRGDKYSDGRYAESNQYPDLELALRSKGEEHLFAVECKWRSSFNKDGFVHWCEDAQLERYNNYSNDKGIPVFIIIGVGGVPSAPETIYCVPLRAMKYSSAKKDYLEGFKHDKGKSFYYHYEENRLD